MQTPRYLLLLALGLPLAASALDLTPRLSSNDMNPVMYRHPYFTEGNTKYAVTVDNQTDIGAEGGAVFRFRNLNEAVFRMVMSPLTPDIGFADAGLEAYRKIVLGFAPKGATEVAILHEDPNPVVVNDWKSYRIILGYKLPGSETRAEFIFLNLDDKQQLMLRTTADAAQFNFASTRAMNIIRTWHAMLPGEDNAERGN